MAGYTKVFSTIWGGSLYGHFEASAVFLVFLSLADMNGTVDMTPEAIAGTTGWPLDFIQKGIRELESPDERSRTKGHEGRRIVLLDTHREWGWVITNYALYREKMRSIERREYLREAQRKHRERDLSTPVNTSTSINQNKPITDTEASTSTEADTKRTKIAPDGAKKASVEEEPRPRDTLWDALLQACGVPLTAPIPKSARGAYNRALKDLREIGADPGQIDAHAQQFRLRWPNVTLTPTALVRRWNECVSQNRSLNHAVR
jgi:hypothetical protein